MFYFFLREFVKCTKRRFFSNYNQSSDLPLSIDSEESFKSTPTITFLIFVKKGLERGGDGKSEKEREGKNVGWGVE